MSKITEAEVFMKFTEMINTSYAQGYQDALNAKQPKLSIPRKIAEELLEGDKIKYPSYELLFNEDGEWSEELQEWMEITDKWWAIVDAYLAGKTLGVELVEVTDD